MRIKVAVENATRAHEALREANGKAERHCYTLLSEVADVAERTERRLIAMGLYKKYWRGIMVSSISGQGVSGSYERKGGAPRRTEVTLQRGASAWYLVAVARDEHHARNVPRDRLLFPEHRMVEITDALRRFWNVDTYDAIAGKDKS